MFITSEKKENKKQKADRQKKEVTKRLDTPM